MTDATPPSEPTNTASTVTPGAPDGEAKPDKKRKATLATWALVLGILGILFAFIPGTGGFAIFLAVVALVLAGIGLSRKQGRRALTGVILGAVALVLGIIFSSVYGGPAKVAPAPAALSTDISSPSPSTSPSASATTPTAQASATQPAAPTGTVAQLQALAAAQGYLASGMGFSQASLAAQLTSSAGNGFAQADAQWAVDNSGADWNAQALEAAQGYLTAGVGFSQASLTAQLTSSAGNQFTADQAAYAVGNAGADWNAQAAKAAKGYMDSGMGFSRQALIDQLTSTAGNQFTEAQAEYGADQVGLK
ncbi:Ltp family lipoprotein [Leifsonia sp. NPDC056824]|uniref:Ltp family lipoprotein n=1 Tax=Leifsonia sp. NPDC056824 TaxID=3345953 RepID=UPI003699CE65